MNSNGTSLPQWKQAVQGNIFAFGLVSFLTDLSSEMIYPLLPVFFSGLVPPTTVAVYIGLIFGVFLAQFGPKPAFFTGALLATAAVFLLAGSLVPGRNKLSPLNPDGSPNKGSAVDLCSV